MPAQPTWGPAVSGCLGKEWVVGLTLDLGVTFSDSHVLPSVVSFSGGGHPAHVVLCDQPLYHTFSHLWAVFFTETWHIYVTVWRTAWVKHYCLWSYSIYEQYWELVIFVQMLSPGLHVVLPSVRFFDTPVMFTGAGGSTPRAGVLLPRAFTVVPGSVCFLPPLGLGLSGHFRSSCQTVPCIWWADTLQNSLEVLIWGTAFSSSNSILHTHFYFTRNIPSKLTIRVVNEMIQFRSCFL